MEPPSQGIFRYFPLRKAHFFTPPLPFPTSLRNSWDIPACSNCLHHLLQGGSFRRKDEIVRFFGWIVHAAANEQPMLPIILPFVQDGNGCPIKDSRPFGALAH